MTVPASNEPEFDLDEIDVNQTFTYVVRLAEHDRDAVIEWAVKAVDRNVARHIAEQRNPGYIAIGIEHRREMDDQAIEAMNQAA